MIEFDYVLDINVIMKTMYPIMYDVYKSNLMLPLLRLYNCMVFFFIILGVEKLVGVYRERPNFADQGAQEDAKQRLCQVSQYRLYVQCIYNLHIYMTQHELCLSVEKP